MISSFEDKNTNENADMSSYSRNLESMFVAVKQEWTVENEALIKSMESFDSEDERTEFYIEKGSDGDEDEETVAMFVTASGQQLALYAVEDSDDYFAVAVYDESGEPPTNFQFLMKSDVERLIREGAVKTVKKPTQIKKQLVTTQPPVFMPNEEITGDIITRAEGQIEAIKRRYVENKITKSVSNDLRLLMKSDPVQKMIPEDDSGSEVEEIVEQSTVQCILCDENQSDAELTFDDIQATLRSMNTSGTHKPLKVKSLANKLPCEYKSVNNGLVHVTVPPFRNNNCREACASSKTKVKFENSSSALSSPVKRSHLSNTSIIGSKQNHGIKKEFSPMADIFTPSSSANFSESLVNNDSCSKVKRSRKQQLISVNREDTEIIIQPASMLQNEEVPLPRKRGRRKKKSASYQKSLKIPTRRSTRSKSRVEIIEIDVDEEDIDKSMQEKEILEITIDENKEKGSSDKENEVIMVRDSDDDEEEESLKVMSPKCRHCSKNFKQRRALDAHMRVCIKLRGKSRKWSGWHTIADSDVEMEGSELKDFEENSKRKCSKAGSKEKSSLKNCSREKKEYTCKTCDEKFDMVVSLARHVRAEHSPKKRGRPSKFETLKSKMQMQVEMVKIHDLKAQKIEKTYSEEKVPKGKKTSVDDRPPTKTEASEKTETTETKAVVAPDANKSSPKSMRKWRPKKPTCGNCGRWFSSTGALKTHSLNHSTKKSVKKVLKKIHCCITCNKVFKSQFLFMKHKSMHTEVMDRLE